MSRPKYLFALIAILAAGLACGIPGNMKPSITPTTGAPILFPTFTEAAAIPTETISPAVPLYGTISGHVNYPSEFIAAQHVVVYLADNFGTYYSVDTALNQSRYTIQVPEGVYFVVSYLSDGSLSAGYSQAVPCGLRVDCTDHSLIPVIVTAGQTIENVDVIDWYAPAGTFPPMP